jgi:hypothetical protein
MTGFGLLLGYWALFLIFKGTSSWILLKKLSHQLSTKYKKLLQIFDGAANDI